VADPADPAGRRANGLPASDWAAMVDVDPRLSEGLLGRLAAAGVAAYVEPASAVDTVHRAVTLPPRPLDRLWVDPDRADQARAVLTSEIADLTALLAEDEPGSTAHGLVHPVPRNAAHRVLRPPALPDPPAPTPPALPGPSAQPGPSALPGPSGPPGPSAQPGPSALPGPPGHPPTPGGPAVPSPGPARSDDEVFAELVARFHGDVAEPDGAPRWPASEDLPSPAEQRRRRTDPPAPPAPPASSPPPPARPVRRPQPEEPALPGWVEPEALDDDGHYVPPPPPPVPRVRLRTLAAVLAVVLGLLVLFAPNLVGLAETTGVGLLGLLLLGGGAGALVWWVRDSSDSGPDDGAVV
jgi:hypothetical protein